MEEKWKKIPEFDRYEISDLGRLRVIKTGYVLAPVLNKKLGYVQQTITGNDGKKHTKRLNRLVGENHVPKIDTKKELNHIDGDKLNNTAKNLEWCTSSENKKHAYKIGLRIKKHKGITTMNNMNRKKCVVLDNKTNEKHFFDSYLEASVFFGKSASWVSDIVNRFNGHTKRYNIDVKEVKESDL